MHRQFTSNGIEYDISRWLKAMGYRGPGLRREILTPLCRGEIAEIWEAMTNSIRSESQLHDIKTRLNLQSRLAASKASRQRSQDEKTRFQELNKNVESLTVACKEDDIEVKALQEEIQRLRDEVIKTDVVYNRHREIAQGKYQKTKILQAMALQTQELIKTYQQDIQSVDRYVQNAKKILESTGECPAKVKTEMEQVLHLMYEFTQHHVSEQVHNRPVGCKLTQEDLLPKMEGAVLQDPKLKQLYHGIGQMYAHSKQYLIGLFLDGLEDTRLRVRQYEMKYCGRRQQTTPAPLVVIEELEKCQIDGFIVECQVENKLNKQQRRLKNSGSSQGFLKSPKRSKQQENFNLQMERYCLKKEINVLETNLTQERCQSEKGKGNEVNLLNKQLLGQTEHSDLMDVLLLSFIGGFKQIQRSFRTTAEEVKTKVKNELLPILKECCQRLNKCEGALSSECRKFFPLSLYGRIKHLGLSEAPESECNEQMPLLQRADLAMKSMIKSDLQDYWIQSLVQVYNEMKESVPCLALESPDALLNHLSNTVESAMVNTSIHEKLKQFRQELEKNSILLGQQTEEFIRMDDERYKWVDQTVSKIDQNLQLGHESLTALHTTVQTSFEDFHNLSAFHSIPWYHQNGMNSAEWISHFKKEQMNCKE